MFKTTFYQMLIGLTMYWLHSYALDAKSTCNETWYIPSKDLGLRSGSLLTRKRVVIQIYIEDDPNWVDAKMEIDS